MLGLATLVLTISPHLSQPERESRPKLKPDLSAAQISALAPRLSKEIESLRRSNLAPGIEVAIVKDDQVVFLKAFGYRDLEHRLPMTVDTQTMIASCSKAFNATVVMLAAHDGKIDLNARPGQYLPYFKLKDPEANAKLTVWDLMNHVAGIPRTDSSGFTYGLTSEEWIASIGDAEPTFKYRENEQYSNVLVHTAGVIAAQSYRTSWPQLVKEKIFDPLGMAHSSAEPYSALPMMALGYDIDSLSGQVRKVPYSDVTGWGVACGGIKSCAKDMAQWLRIQLNHGRLGDRQVIPAEVIDDEHKVRFASNDLVDIASGWFVDHGYGTDVYGHDGALNGFLTSVTLVPERHLGMAVLTNSYGGGKSAVVALLRKELLGDPNLKSLNEFRFKVRGLYTDPTHHDFERISFLSETGALSINRLGEPKVRLHRLQPRSGADIYETADPRNRQVRIEFNKAGFKLTEAGQSVDYSLAVPGTSVVSTREFQARITEAYGGKAAVIKPHSFTADFENHYVNEGLQTRGHWYHAWPHRFGQWEAFFGFGRKLGSSQSVTTPRRSISAATFSNLQNALPFEPRYLSNAQRFCDAPDWSHLYEYVRVVGTTDLKGEPVYVVLKHPKFPTHALDVVDYVSQKSALVLRRELGPLDQPEDYSQAWEFGDFTSVDGVLLPATITNIDTGEHRVVTKLKNIRTVSRIPGYVFQIGDFKGQEAPFVEFR